LQTGRTRRACEGRQIHVFVVITHSLGIEKQEKTEKIKKIVGRIKSKSGRREFGW